MTIILTRARLSPPRGTLGYVSRSGAWCTLGILQLVYCYGHPTIQPLRNKEQGLRNTISWNRSKLPDHTTRKQRGYKGVDVDVDAVFADSLLSSDNTDHLSVYGGLL